MERIYEGTLIAFIPYYEDNVGNVTKVYLKDGEPFIIRKKLPYVLKELCRHYSINLEHLKEVCIRELGCKKLFPIPFGKGNTFIAFKIRKPSISNDGAFGYINYKYIEHIVYYTEKRKMEVLLENNKIDCISKLESVRRHIRMGQIISHTYSPLVLNELKVRENLFIIKK